MNKALKWILIAVGSGLLLFIGYVFFVFATFSFATGKQYSKQDLIDNYNAKSHQIMELKNYINAVVPANKSVEIEFEGDNRFFIFHVVDNGSSNSNWDLKMNSPKVNELLRSLNWDEQTLEMLKKKLDAANCISVESGEPCTIGFQRSGMGKYYYKVFDKPLSDSLKDTYNDSCTYILYNDRIVLEYGGGAVGPQCFPTR